MHSHAKSWVHGLLLLAAAGSGLAVSTHDLPSALDSPAVSGWVLADLNGDQSVDLATAQSGRHDANGYAQEVRVTLGAFQQTSFRFLSPGATVELSSQDVDGDDDGDLVVFEPLSSQPIGVWINDGAGTFHEGRLGGLPEALERAPGVGMARARPAAPVIRDLRRANAVPGAFGGDLGAGIRRRRTHLPEPVVFGGRRLF